MNLRVSKGLPWPRSWLVVFSFALLGAFAVEASQAQPAARHEGAESPALADIDLDDVLVSRALRLLAEIYDVSVATGELPESRVTVRLRGVGAEEAFEAVTAAAGVEISHHGSTVLVSAPTAENMARKIILGSFPAGAANLDWLGAAGVDVQRISDAALLLVGPESAVAAASEALDRSRQQLTADRVFRLGVVPGEEALSAVTPLLEPGLEFATYDATSHLLRLTAMPTTVRRIESLLGELTQSPTQYEIEVRVIEVSRTALKRMGSQGSFRLDIRGGVLATSFPYSDLDDSSRYFPSLSDLATLSNTANVGGSNVNDTTGSLQDAGFRFGRVDARGLGLLIEFLEQSGEARVMATPKVTALDNRLARISMVTTLRIPTFTQNDAFATTTVTGIEEIDVGTTLEVRPRRGEGRQILLKVTPEVSELEPTAEVFTQNGLTQGLPVITRRRTETEVLLETGETLVIGGLVTENEVETVGKTPGLGDIPLIGRAFRLKGRETDSSELLIFVTPRELPPPDERRAKVRVDDAWIPAGLAARVDEARSRIRSESPSQQIAGIHALGTLDGDLRAEGLDLGPDVVALGADPSLDVRVAAALFLLRWRPTNALAELVRFADSRAVALSALATPITLHLRAALAELVGRSEGGVELLGHQFDEAVASGDVDATASLLEALCAADPDLAANKAAGLTAESLALPISHRLDALSGSGGYEGELLRHASTLEQAENQAFAIAGLVRALGPAGTTEFLAGHSDLPLSGRLEQQIRALGPSITRPTIPEPGLAWSGTPDEIEIRGEGRELIEDALDLLARRAPDLRHLVGFAMATIDSGEPRSGVDPVARAAWVANDTSDPIRMAHRLVRLATIVFESRVRGFPATGGRSLARAVREEIRALERLTGAPCSPERVEKTVRQVLATTEFREIGNV